jgi:CheY-like chemotaxis protein
MEPVKIVVVDDDEDFRDNLQVILESHGYRVTTAGGRADGLDLIRQEKPDVAILDVMMDHWADGFEMAREIREWPGLASMRVLILTGVTGKTGIEFKTTAGDPVWLPVDGYLDKPVEPEVLLGEVRRLLGQHA